LDGLQGSPGHGQVLAIFATVVTACEGVVLLALSLWIYQKTHSSAIGKK
jgi:NADH:ubiquinone oxidoreductase subunit K